MMNNKHISSTETIQFVFLSYGSSIKILSIPKGRNEEKHQRQSFRDIPNCCQPQSQNLLSLPKTNICLKPSLQTSETNIRLFNLHSFEPLWEKAKGRLNPV